MTTDLSAYVKKYFLLFSCLIVSIGLGLRLMSINPFGIWFDEQCSLRGSMGQIFDPGYKSDNITPESIQASAQPPEHFPKVFLPSDFHLSNKIENVIPAMLITDRGNGPLHYIQGHFWIKIFGQSDMSVRLNSVLYSILTLIALLWLTSTYFNPSLALMAGLLYAAHPVIIKYATQFRPYSLGSLFAVLSTFAILKIVLEAKNKNYRNLYYVGYFLSSAALFFSHYLTAYILLGHVLFCIISLRDRVTWTKLVICGFGICALFVVWLNNGANDAVRVMGAHSKLWAQRLLADGGFSLSELFREIKILIVKLAYIQSGFDSSDLKILGSKFFYRFIKTITSVSTLIALFYFFRTIPKGDLKFRLLLSIFAACIIYAVSSSLQSQHYLPFVDRYNVFAFSIGGIAFAYMIQHLYALTKKLWIKNVLIGIFMSQFIICLVHVFLSVHKNNSYNWENKNVFVDAARNVMSFDSQNHSVLYPTWNIANMTNLYISKNFEIEQSYKKSEEKNIIYIVEKKTQNKIPITDHIEE